MEKTRARKDTDCCLQGGSDHRLANCAPSPSGQVEQPWSPYEISCSPAYVSSSAQCISCSSYSLAPGPQIHRCLGYICRAWHRIHVLLGLRCIWIDYVALVQRDPTYSPDVGCFLHSVVVQCSHVVCCRLTGMAALAIQWGVGCKRRPRLMGPA